MNITISRIALSWFVKWFLGRNDTRWFYDQLPPFGSHVWKNGRGIYCYPYFSVFHLNLHYNALIGGFFIEDFYTWVLFLVKSHINSFKGRGSWPLKILETKMVSILKRFGIVECDLKHKEKSKSYKNNEHYIYYWSRDPTPSPSVRTYMLFLWYCPHTRSGLTYTHLGSGLLKSTLQRHLNNFTMFFKNFEDFITSVSLTPSLFSR